jgi:hypothetical protein
MNASGKTISRAPLRIACPVRSKAFTVLRSRSKGTEPACTTATRNRSMLPIVHSGSGDDQLGVTLVNSVLVLLMFCVVSACHRLDQRAIPAVTNQEER